MRLANQSRIAGLTKDNLALLHEPADLEENTRRTIEGPDPALDEGPHLAGPDHRFYRTSRLSCDLTR